MEAIEIAGLGIRQQYHAHRRFTYDLKEPTALMQFTGQPLITAIKYERETLRCAKCQQRYIAPLPEGVRDERYDATCDATIALM